MKLSYPSAAIKLRNIRKSASRRGYDCTLTIGNVKKLMKETKCAYTGETFTDSGDNTMSFDRIDNTRGYEPGNVIPVTLHSNQLKSNYDVGTMQKLSQSTGKRFNAHMNSVNLQIDKKEAKIKSRMKQIEDLQKLLEKDVMEMEHLVDERNRATGIVADAVRDGQIYADIVRVLESNKQLGNKYLTVWQKAKRYFGGAIFTKVKLTLLSQNNTEGQIP